MEFSTFAQVFPGFIPPTYLMRNLYLYLLFFHVFVPEGIKKIDLLPDQPIPEDDGVCLEISLTCTPGAILPFRTLDGTCNNLREGRRGWGATERPFRRRLQPIYADGKEELNI